MIRSKIVRWVRLSLPKHRAEVDNSPLEELKKLAQEVQDLVRNKVGTTEFANAYNIIHQKVVNVRRDRKNARMMLVSGPAFYLYINLNGFLGNCQPSGCR